MKKSIIFLWGILILSLPSMAQGFFEGKINYKVSIEGDNAEMFAAFMPESFNYLIGKNDIKFSIKGGMMESMMGEWLVNNESGTAYMLQHSSQTAYKIDPETAQSEEVDFKPEITSSDKTKEIAGYNCRMYEVTLETPQGDMKQEIWATKDIKVKKPSVEAAGNMSQVFIEGLDAFPLEIVSDMPMGMGKMTMSANEVQAGNVDDTMFKVPSDYKVEKFDPQKFGEQMMGNYR